MTMEEESEYSNHQKQQQQQNYDNDDYDEDDDDDDDDETKQNNLARDMDEAIENGDLDFVKRTLRAGWNIDQLFLEVYDATYGAPESTTLYWAVDCKQVDIVDHLLDDEDDDDDDDETKQNNLARDMDEAIKKGDLDRVKRTLKAGWNINQLFPERYDDDNDDWCTCGAPGSTALYWAVDCNQVDIVDYLLDQGANVNLSPRAPLHRALRLVGVGEEKDRRHRIVRLLVEKGGASVLNYDQGKHPSHKDYPTPIRGALGGIMDGGGDPQILQYLLSKCDSEQEKRSAMEFVDHGGGDAIILALTVCKQCLQVLLENGAVVTEKHIDYARQRERPKALDLLVLLVQKVESLDLLLLQQDDRDDKNTTMILDQRLQVLLENDDGGGAVDVTERNINAAIKFQRVKALDLLLKHVKANSYKINARDYFEDKMTILERLCKRSPSEYYRQDELVQVLLDHGARLLPEPEQRFPTPLHLACQVGATKVVSVLLDHLDANKEEEEGVGILDRVARFQNIEKGCSIERCPLNLAIENQHMDIVKELLRRGANVHIMDDTTTGYWSISYAISAGNVDMVRLLSRHDPSVSSPRMLYAIMTGNQDIMNRVLSCRDPSVSDQQGQQDYSPLGEAIDMGNNDMADIILHDNPHNLQNVIFPGALIQACYKGDARMVNLLLWKGANPNEEVQSNRPLYAACERGDGAMVDALLNQAPDIVAADRCSGREGGQHGLLYWACTNGLAHQVERILSLPKGKDLRFDVKVEEENILHKLIQYVKQHEDECDLDATATCMQALLQHRNELIDDTNSNQQTPWKLCPYNLKQAFLRIVDKDLLYRLVELRHQILFDLVQDDENANEFADKFEHILSKDRNVLKWVDGMGRKVLQLASRECRRASLFFARYDLDMKVRYESPTCQVYFAQDYGESDNKEEPTPVALKFMNDKENYETEMEARRIAAKDDSDKARERFDKEFIIADLNSHDDKKFQDACKKLNPNMPRYCIVLEQGDYNLEEYLVANQTVTRDPIRFLPVLKDIALCLAHMHSVGFIHGDLKPRNVIRQKSDEMWQLSDFDASVQVVREDDDKDADGNPDKRKKQQRNYIGRKVSTAYAPPELFHVRKGGQVDLRTTSSSSSSAPQDINPLEADYSFDIWSFGVIMYKLLTGFDLFPHDTRDDILPRHWKVVGSLGQTEMQKKLDEVDDKHAKELLQKILHTDPSKRPTMKQILEDPYFKGQFKEGSTQLKMLEQIIEKIDEQTVELKSTVTEKIDSLGDDLRAKVKNVSDKITKVAKVSEATNNLVAQLYQDPAPRLVCFDYCPKKAFHAKSLVSRKCKMYFICPLTFQVMNDSKQDHGYDFYLAKDWVVKFGPAILLSALVIQTALNVTQKITKFPIDAFIGDKSSEWLQSLLENFGQLGEEHKELIEGCLECVEEPLESEDSLAQARETDDDGINDNNKKKFSHSATKACMELAQWIATKKEDPDPKFKRSGLKMALCKRDGSVEFVHPDYQTVYEEYGKECFTFSPQELEEKKAKVDFEHAEKEAAEANVDLMRQKQMEEHRNLIEGSFSRPHRWIPFRRVRYDFVLSRDGSFRYSKGGGSVPFGKQKLLKDIKAASLGDDNAGGSERELELSFFKGDETKSYNVIPHPEGPAETTNNQQQQYPEQQAGTTTTINQQQQEPPGQEAAPAVQRNADLPEDWVTKWNERAFPRSRMSREGQLVADAYLWYTNNHKIDGQDLQVDAAIRNGGGVRKSLSKKVDLISGKESWNIGEVYPHNESVVVLELTGAQLIAALENAVGQYPLLKGRFPQVAGMKIQFTASKPGLMASQDGVEKPRRLYGLQIVGVQQSRGVADVVELIREGKVTNRDLLKKRFRIATTKYLANGENGFLVFKECRPRWDVTKRIHTENRPDTIAPMKEVEIVQEYLQKRLDGNPFAGGQVDETRLVLRSNNKK